mgnify:CR=1 FL=1
MNVRRSMRRAFCVRRQGLGAKNCRGCADPRGPLSPLARGGAGGKEIVRMTLMGFSPASGGADDGPDCSGRWHLVGSRGR